MSGGQWMSGGQLGSLPQERHESPNKQMKSFGNVGRISESRDTKLETL